MRLLLLLFFYPLLTHAAPRDSLIRAGSITVGGLNYNYRETCSTEEGITKTFELYRGTNKILSHILYNEEADCDSKGLELGDFSTNDSTITFYSYWAWVGGCCSPPYGARKQVYCVSGNGALHLTQSAIYLQRYTYAISAMEKDEALQFIANIEKEYNATFVLGKQADDLITAVKQRFAKTIAKETKGWERNRFGYRR